MSKKDLFIGEFKISHCNQYGAFGIIKSLKEGQVLFLYYEQSDKEIMVRTDINNSNTTIGDLEVPEQVKKIMVPLLLGKYKEDLFECKLNPFDGTGSLIERIKVTIWAKKADDDGNLDLGLPA